MSDPNKPFDTNFISNQLTKLAALGWELHRNHTSHRWSYNGSNASVFSISSHEPGAYFLTKGGAQREDISAHQQLKILEEEQPAYDLFDSIKSEFRKIPLFNRGDLQVSISVAGNIQRTPKVQISVDQLTIHHQPLIPRNLAKRIKEVTDPLLQIDEGLPLRKWRMLSHVFLAQSPQTALLKFAIFKNPALLTKCSEDGNLPHFPDPALIEDHPEVWEAFCKLRPSTNSGDTVLVRRR
jgi:hypothetical protein